MTPLLLAALAAVDAPVTQVTVFTDQARVVRTAQVQVNGTASVELPPLRDSADVNTIKVETSGAEVKRVDIERIAPEKLRTDEAKKLLAELDALDQELERLSLERQALSAARDRLQALTPTVPEGNPLQAPPKLNASGWSAGGAFAVSELTKVHARLRDAEHQQKKTAEKREKLLDQARRLGNPQTTSGWKVVAQLSGNGPATLTLTYLVSAARWTPTWDLQLQPDTNTVNLSLAGLVSQDTGEEWANATLLLSTAIPSRAVVLPKLATWKIGVADRFIPTPSKVWSPVTPAPPVRPLTPVRSEEDLVRNRLARIGVAVAGPEGSVVSRSKTYDFSGEEIEGELLQEQEERTRALVDRRDANVRRKTKAMPRAAEAPAMAPPPPPAPSAMAGAAPGRYALESTTVAERGEADSEPPPPVSTFSLAPPPAWQPPRFGPDSPVTLAAGYDLSFTSLQKETVPSARGARRVALWSAQWPVSVERKLFPALTSDAFLVAELKNPSQQVLPGGPAQLYVGADPAGTAQLKLVSPGEAFTLPLGIDRALKPVRNVQLVEATQGVFSKDEVGTYTVTIELANPYRAPIAVRVADQWPVTDQKELETRLVDSKPTATQDQKRGGLEWRLTIAPQQKQVFSFTYTVKRPKGWKLQQQEVVR